MSDTTEHLSDADLVMSAQQGDMAAFGDLVRRHQKSAIRIAAVAAGSATDAEDIAQEAFVKAHAAISRFRPDARFEPWLFRIVTNTAKNRNRSEKRYAELSTRVARMAETGGIEPSEVAVHRSDSARLVAAINRLSADDRLILTYRWYEELSEAEIAAALGCRAGTVKSRLSRARQRLSNELGDEV